MTEAARTVGCPRCGAQVPWGHQSPFRPFCSERCRLIDLGKWASGGYVISTPITDPEAFESQVEEQRRRGDGEDSPNERRRS